MSHTYIKDLFLEAVHSVTSDISQYTSPAGKRLHPKQKISC